MNTHVFQMSPNRPYQCVLCQEAPEHAVHALPDTGARAEYDTGAVREADPNKPALEGISPYALIRLGALLTKANAKYGSYRNWEKGIPVTRYIGGILRHTLAYMMRDTSEDHLAAIMWNAMAIIHHEEVGSTSGKSFSELDDRPVWHP